MKVLTSLIFVFAVLINNCAYSSAEVIECNVVILGNNLKTIDVNSASITDPAAKNFFKFLVDTSKSDSENTFAHRYECIEPKQFKGNIVKGVVCLDVRSGPKELEGPGLQKQKDKYFQTHSHALFFDMYVSTVKWVSKWTGRGTSIGRSSFEVSLPVTEFRTVLGELPKGFRDATVTCKEQS